MNSQVILLVEDDSSIREGIRILLGGEGYTVLEAGSGEEALSRMNDAVDLVILDIMGEQEINLTETEYQILLMLMKRPNRAHSAKVIYEGIWGEQFYYGAGSTVMVHIKNLRRKLETDPQNPSHIVTVWGKGYQFRKQEIV